jgi:sigma-E factor negative regulatory protein RseA
MDTNKKNREYISALSDDGIAPSDQELALAALLTPEGMQAWNLYHRIGDTLRAAASPDLSSGFAARLAERLAAEPMPAKRPAPASDAVDAPAAFAGPH